jgi:hypothetical protein
MWGHGTVGVSPHREQRGGGTTFPQGRDLLSSRSQDAGRAAEFRMTVYVINRVSRVERRRAAAKFDLPRQIHWQTERDRRFESLFLPTTLRLGPTLRVGSSRVYRT